jgi:3-oxoacyl-[acyl-carrier-protein] synthase-3
MPATSTKSHHIAGIATCVPSKVYDNTLDCTAFPEEDVRKVVAMAGISRRHIADDSICSSDLCITAAKALMKRLEWAPESVDALIMVTQSPDYILPTTACVMQAKLGLRAECAAFDVGLGCSGYPYGLWLASLMLQSPGIRRVLLCHGETPSRFTHESDRSVFLLFGDVGSTTALEAGNGTDGGAWHFCLNTDGGGYDTMIMRAGGFRMRTSSHVLDHCVQMDGAKIFNFTIKRVPPLVKSTLAASGRSVGDIDYFIFHQSNRYIMKHLAKQLGISDEKIPLTLDNFGNTGGASIPLTITRGDLERDCGRPLLLMLLGYGVGLSWGSALIELESTAVLEHVELDNGKRNGEGASIG